MKQLDPKSVWLFFISFILRMLIPAIFIGSWGLSVFIGRLQGAGRNEAIFLFFQNGITFMIFLALAYIILCFIWAKLTYHFYRYELTEAGFRKELGVVYKKYVTIPYDRIQNVDIYRGIWARILGLSDLNIQTAGASAVVGRQGFYGIGSEGRLPALSKETAEQLRDELIQRARQSKNQGL